MNIEEAKKINSAIIGFGLAPLGLKESDPTPLENVSLADMIEAVRMVRIENDTEGRTSRSLVADDRLTSAVYTLLRWHYDGMHGPDGDTIIATLNGRGSRVFFVMVGCRDTADAAEEEDAEA